MHAGFRRMFETTREGVGSIINPAELRWIGLSHFEPGECGALNEWLGVAPHAQGICSRGCDGDGQRLRGPCAAGACRQRNPSNGSSPPAIPFHPARATRLGRGLVPRRDGRTLFCLDLFFQPGDPEPVIESGITALARPAIEQSIAEPLANDLPYTGHTDGALRRLAALKPACLATMHGSTFRGNGEKARVDLAVVLKDILGTSDIGS